MPQKNADTVQEGSKDLIRQLTCHVADLEAELETSHARNQKLVEAQSGPLYGLSLSLRTLCS